MGSSQSEGLVDFVPAKWGGAISLLAENARWTREDVVSCAQRQHGVDTTRHHLKEFQHKWGSWTSRRRFSKPVTRPPRGYAPGARLLQPHRGDAPPCGSGSRIYDVSGAPRLRYSPPRRTRRCAPRTQLPHASVFFHILYKSLSS
jgi:hypothetical protein